MSTHNPSHGQKVDLGHEAPIKHEGPGKVAKESLAKESIKEGGEFSHNEGIQGENQPPSGREGTSTEHHSKSSHKSAESENTSASRATKSSAPGAGSESKSSGGDHGENKAPMGESNTDGLQKALASEPGSMNDPSRLAERQMLEHNSAVGREGGPRQGEIDSETPFDPLKTEASS
ncbi:hypothetical protein F53441_5869 [Fusarium austroafricanum]|uniref:Uncharacterized protein n=1 Tax=Fusarium austroafricanum TaxID=2364996 RepID=A0A8H4NXA8_9HYPO|nr:hypothetical protein F53441_5869 [Fusarium austroafricanum]